ncbi:MAG TPA: hypothetical protein VFD25_00760 [Clostridia bacterium]|nr:hypothetical protein [Clostridia bacterium]
MNCFNCKKVGVKENEFCPHCGALVPRRSADVAKYADFQLDGKSIASKQSINNKSEAYETPVQKWLAIWQDIQKEFNEQSYKGQGGKTASQSYGVPDKTRQSQNAYNTAFEEPRYRQATRQPAPRRTATKKPSFLPGIVIFVVIFVTTIILPNVLSNIDFNEYSEDFFEVTIENKSDPLYMCDYLLTDFDIENLDIKNNKMIAFDILFNYPTPFTEANEYNIEYSLNGYVEVLGLGHYPATLDERGIHIQKCDFELNTAYTFLTASFHNEKENCDYNYYFSKPYSDGITIVFEEGGSCAIR